jgi:hypothetical protein
VQDSSHGEKMELDTQDNQYDDKVNSSDEYKGMSTRGHNTAASSTTLKTDVKSEHEKPESEPVILKTEDKIQELMNSPHASVLQQFLYYSSRYGIHVAVMNNNLMSLFTSRSKVLCMHSKSARNSAFKQVFIPLTC